ncbi:MAG: iron ABC transporter permease, partial [Pseudomonadota bacterium]
MRTANARDPAQSVLIFWIVIGWVGFFVLPWYAIEDGFFTFEWLFDGYPFDTDYAPAAFLIAQGEKLWLAPLALPLFAVLAALGRPKSDPRYATVLIAASAFSCTWLLFQGFGIGLRGWQFGVFESLFGPLGDRQFGMGYGALFLATALLFLFT